MILTPGEKEYPTMSELYDRFQKELSQTTYAVSYTHLDVYKRQAIKSVPFSNHGCRMANGVVAVFPTVISGFPVISKPFM